MEFLKSMHRVTKMAHVAALAAGCAAMASGAALAQSGLSPAPPSTTNATNAVNARNAANATSAETAAPLGGGKASTPSAARPPQVQPASDPAAIGRAVLNAGPDPRVQLDGLSRDHAAIFGTDNEDEQALLDQERALQAQRDQLKVLERVLNAGPPAADPNPPAMIPLNPGAPMNMPRLAPTPSGSELDRAGSASRRSVDDMQRRVNALRRDADTLRQSGR
ncbi:hypothetical protein [Achromobacter sp.]|uniref:hypothetical protein n=1 Tax=Achromobacter sp. TaxID=134375 RepID=UPI0028AE9706|nr:hypothetical protein [Achromobacter sp.]